MTHRLTHVCVFPNRAKLTHEVDVGTSGAALEGLSPFVDDASITARVLSGDGEVREIRVERYLAARAKDTAEAQEKLRQEQARLERELAHARQELDSLGALVSEAQSTNIAPGESFVRPSSKALLGAQNVLAEFVTTQSTAVLLEIEAREQRLEAIEKALVAARDTPGGFRWAKRVHLSTSESCRIALSYVTLGASWRPSYQVFFDTEKKRVCVQMIAAIAQQTAFDWEGVPVRVSTAADTRITPLPKWKALRIGKAQGSVDSDFRPPPPNPGALYGDYDQATQAQAARRQASRGFAQKKAVASYGGRPGGFAMPSEAAALEVTAREATMDSMAAFDEAIDEEVLMSVRAEPAMASLPNAPVRAKRARSAPRPLPQTGASPPAAAAMLNPMTIARAARETGAVNPGLNDLWLHFELLELAEPADKRRRGRLTFRKNDIDDTLSLAPPPPSTIEPSASGRAAFDLAGQVSLPASGQWRTFVVGSWGAEDAALDHVVVPRKAREVFRTLRFKSPLDGPIFSGPTSIFVDDRLLATSNTEHVPAGGELSLGAGVNEAITVTRDARFEEESAGLFSGSKMLHHRVRIEVHNASDKDEMLRVRDRIPVPFDENTKVEVLLRKVTPAEGRVENETFEKHGEIRWEFKMKPREQRVIELEYTVRIKNGQELVGGNRREP